MTTIDTILLDTVTGGAGMSLKSVLGDLKDAQLTPKQLGKVDNKILKLEGKGKKGGFNAIAEGDFGAAPSNFITLRGD